MNSWVQYTFYYSFIVSIVILYCNILNNLSCIMYCIFLAFPKLLNIYLCNIFLISVTKLFEERNALHNVWFQIQPSTSFCTVEYSCRSCSLISVVWYPGLTAHYCFISAHLYNIVTISYNLLNLTVLETFVKTSNTHTHPHPHTHTHIHCDMYVDCM